MNKLKRYRARFILPGLLFIHFAIPAASQTADANDRKYIADHLCVFFIPNVNSTAVSTSVNKFFRVDIAGKKNTKKSFFGNGGYAFTVKADSVLKCIFNDPAFGGDAKLQYILSKIFRIRGAPIMLLLFDDKDSLTNTAIEFYHLCAKEQHVWFCANSMRYAVSGPLARFQGFIKMGTCWINRIGVHQSNAAMCHELLHTQDQTDLDMHGFYITQLTGNPKDPVSVKRLPYGADGRHLRDEAIPQMLAAYAEGIADASAFMYMQNEFSNYSYLHALMWFSDGCLIRIEKNNYDHAENPMGSADNWLYEQLILSGVRPYMQNDTHVTYFLRDLPDLRIAMHNESIIAMIIETYNVFVGYSNFFDLVKIVGREKGNLALFFNELCNAPIPEDRHDKPKSTPEQGVFPLALADYFTRYKAADKANFKRMFDDLENNSTQLSDAYLNTYWSVRGDLKLMLMANANRGSCASLELAKDVYTEDFNAIAQRLNIKAKK